MAKKKSVKKKPAASKKNKRAVKVSAKGATGAKSAKGPKKFVYFFGNGKADGERSMKDT